MGTSLHVGGLVTLVAGVHYMYMREYWVQLHKSPVVYRYIDWTITVPLQMIEFNLILKAAKAPISSGGFWRLLIGTILMLVFGYVGETTPGFGWPGFISIAMIAATVFFFAEASTVHDHWRTSLHVGGLVTLVAGVHYMYMREYWVQLHKYPVVYRYIDWTIT